VKLVTVCAHRAQSDGGSSSGPGSLPVSASGPVCGAPLVTRARSAGADTACAPTAGQQTGRRACTHWHHPCPGAPASPGPGGCPSGRACGTKSLLVRGVHSKPSPSPERRSILPGRAHPLRKNSARTALCSKAKEPGGLGQTGPAGGCGGVCFGARHAGALVNLRRADPGIDQLADDADLPGDGGGSTAAATITGSCCGSPSHWAAHPARTHAPGPLA
jgi:hypothetical protein